jgi:alanyl-tRNA synthetase
MRIVRHDTTDGDARALAVAVRDRLPAARPGVVAVGTPADDRATPVAAVSSAARSAGRDASALGKRLLDGRGGGSPELAQGGGIPSERLADALASVPALLTGACRGA